MRNLEEHPITYEEIILCLERLSLDLSQEERIGDMRPLLLQKAAEIIRAEWMAS